MRPRRLSTIRPFRLRKCEDPSVDIADIEGSVILVTAAGTGGNTLTPSHDLVPLVMARAGRKLSPIVLRLARPSGKQVEE